MTIGEIADQLYSLSGGWMGEDHHVGRQDLRRALKRMFASNPGRQTLVIRPITLPDGDWAVFLTQYGDHADEYDYLIPDIRAEEDRRLKGG